MGSVGARRRSLTRLCTEAGPMVLASALESAGVVMSIVTPLVAVPLTILTFYLRSVREHQVTRHADLVREVESVQAAVVELRRALAEIERDFTTKEEWLRECMDARRALEQLSRSTIRLETTVGALMRRGEAGGMSDQSMFDAAVRKGGADEDGE